MQTRELYTLSLRRQKNSTADFCRLLVEFLLESLKTREDLEWNRASNCLIASSIFSLEQQQK